MQNSSVDLDAALEFTRRHGSPLVHALASFAAGRAENQTALDELKALQNPDGGWRDLDPDLRWSMSTLSMTHVALHWLAWIGAGDTDLVDRTVRFLQMCQHADGHWDEPAEIVNSDPPRWMLPGRYGNQLWLTSTVCQWLIELGREGDVQIDRALDFLRDGWDGVRFPEYNHTHWAAMAAFNMSSSARPEDQEIVRGCVDFLNDALERNEIDPSDITAVADAARRAGPAAGDLRATALQRVGTGQADDGGWTTRYGDIHRGGATANALFVLRLADD